MEFDPHALHQILIKIQDQMRCPQCAKAVPVDIASVKLAGDDFMLLQLKCENCQAFIVLHVSLTGAVKQFSEEKDGISNVSSTLELDEEELATLNAALEKSGGSFGKLFEENEKRNHKPDSPSTFA